MSEAFRSSWEESYIIKYFELLIGGTPSRSNNAYWDNTKLTGNKWVSIKDIKRRYISDTEEQITDLGVKKSNVKLIPENTVIMSFKLTIGRLTITKCPLYTNEAIVSFIPKKSNSVDTNYLYYGLQSWNLLGEVDQAVKGATLNKDKMSKILGLFPPLPEQKKIASILTSVDEVIENTQKQIDKLQDLKKATMTELLTKGIDHTEFKDSELGRIPKSWEIRFIGDLCEIDTGKRDTQNKEKFGKYPFFVRSQKVERISSYSYDGEAVLTAGDGVGTGKIYHYVDGKFDFHQRVYKLSDFADEIFGKFLFYYFSNNFLRQVQKFSAKGSVESVRMEMITGMKIPVPPKPEQLKISKTLSAIENSLEKSVKKLTQTQFLKKSLMQDLLTGKVRVQVS